MSLAARRKASLSAHFFRNAIKGAEEELIGIVKAHINTRTLAPTTHLAGLLGESLKDRIQRSITTLRTPPNSAATIKAKGSSNPLIDTTFMHNSVDYKIDSYNTSGSDRSLEPAVPC